MVLEEKVQVLQKEVDRLTSKVTFYKNLLDTHSIDVEAEIRKHKFIEEDEYMKNDFANLIENSPELVRSSTHFQLWETSGIAGESRIEFIKKAFN